MNSPKRDPAPANQTQTQRYSHVNPAPAWPRQSGDGGWRRGGAAK